MITDKIRQERRSYIGGSDVAIILGLSTYKTPYQLWLEKTGAVDLSQAQEESQQQMWGNKLEPVIRDHFAEKHGLHIELPETIRHPEYDFLAANVDGYIPEMNAILEVKCSGAYQAKSWGEQGTDQVPEAYLCQAAHYCFVMDASRCYFAVLIGGNDYREYKYERDYALETDLLEACQNFWDCVQNNLAPAPINADDVRKMFPENITGKTVKATGHILEKIGFLMQVRDKMKPFNEQIKSLEEKEAEYKTTIMEYMSDSETLLDNDSKPLITWKKDSRGTRKFVVKS